MDPKDRKTLESLGWKPEMLDRIDATRAITPVDTMFLEGARKALAQAGFGALAFLSANPGVSELDLARRLNRGVSAIGLRMAIYSEASEQGVVRAVAKDLLLRQIRAKFPEGWSHHGNVHPLVRIGGWDSDVGKYSCDENAGVYARQIVRDLAIDHPPPRGWKPLPEKDPLIDELFDRHWPVGPNDTEGA